MTSDGKIYIVITDKLPAGTEPAQVNYESKKESKSDNELFGHWARTRLLNEAKQLATQVTNYQLSNIGNFTGDYITQTKINDAINNINGLVSIGLSTLAGAKYGPWGAVIGAAVGVLNVGVSSALNIHTNRIENSKTNYEIEQLRVRAGLNTLFDGSRGTEN